VYSPRAGKSYPADLGADRLQGFEQDRQARFGGYQRQQSMGAERQGGFGGGRFHR
jgi:hypothetical protein